MFSHSRCILIINNSCSLPVLQADQLKKPSNISDSSHTRTPTRYGKKYRTNKTQRNQIFSRYSQSVSPRNEIHIAPLLCNNNTPSAVNDHPHWLSSESFVLFHVVGYAGAWPYSLSCPTSRCMSPATKPSFLPTCHLNVNKSLGPPFS